jgi:very-short-patch-repair endonuclease
MKKNYHYGYNRTLVSFARSNRKQENDAERLLWYYVRNRQLGGYKFRRQYPIHNYIIDFYCDELKLAIELDGSQHNENKLYDEERDLALKALGIRVIRFWDYDVFQNTNNVLEQILIVIEEVLAKEPHPNPLLRGEGIIQKK